ncbi:hypothetical protein Fmac_014364 [Flemingia macrophylla]|uniref:PB1 domain-containing protein n=1 Tax=Flemingia macrophylla TaxID=520843 RepID=A0ABD1MBJ9_9FABA
MPKILHSLASILIHLAFFSPPLSLVTPSHLLTPIHQQCHLGSLAFRALYMVAGKIHQSCCKVQGTLTLKTSLKPLLRFKNQGQLGAHLAYPGSAVIYHELLGELAQMFGIEGKLEDPLKSGWQLVFVDSENDVPLLGDEPWESFVNNVWYIKILSHEDIQKMREQAVESLALSSGQRLNGAESQDIVSGPPSIGSLEY